MSISLSDLLLDDKILIFLLIPQLLILITVNSTASNLLLIPLISLHYVWKYSALIH